MNQRFLARVILEAVTPLQIGTGEKDVVTDQLVALDVNQLPYIPGTAVAGVLRNIVTHEIGEENVNQIFGFQGAKEVDSFGSRLIISSGQMIGKDGKVIEGLKKIDFSDIYYNKFKELPVRQHVRISDKGATEQTGKFDNQIVYKGARFCFELEMISDESQIKEDREFWETLLNTFTNRLFRLGGGTRKGYGEIKVVEIRQTLLDLKKELPVYLTKTSNLNDGFWSDFSHAVKKASQPGPLSHYKLQLTPDDFFLFSSGMESQDADITYVTEEVIEWNDKGIPRFSEKKILIPASSVKGTFHHRTVYHYNKLQGIFADKLDEMKDNTVTGQEAVKQLYGFSADDDKGMRGKALFSDIYLDENPDVKLLNHVSIDRFTGGAIAGALFSEEVIYNNNQSIELEVWVDESAFKESKEDNGLSGSTLRKAFLATLNDVCTGLLPLGGGTMRGHGTFSGKFFINEKEVQL